MEGVGDLIEQGGEGPVRRVAEEDADRVEAVAEDARHGQQAYRPAGDVDPRLRQMALDLGAQGAAGAVAMVRGSKADQAEPPSTQQTQAGLEAVQLIEIGQHHPDTIAQAMVEAARPLMHDLADIEGGSGGVGQRRFHAASVSRSGSADGRR